MMKLAGARDVNHFLEMFPKESDFIKKHGEQMLYMYGGGYYADGGMAPEQQGGMPPEQGGGAPQQGGGDQMQQIVQFIAQALQQGMQPEEIVKKLIEAGLPEDQAAQIVQAVIQQMQGAQQNPGGPEPNGVQEYPQGPQEEMAEGPQGQEAPPQEAMEGQPPMRMGGTPCYNCGGMYANGGTYYQGNYFAQGGPFIPQYGDIAWNVDYATGGEAGMSNELVMQVAQLLQQGVQPEAILQQLVKAKIPQKKAVKIIQTVMQKLQGAQQAVDQQGIDQQQGAMMAYGGVPVVKTTTINPNYNVDVRTTINPDNLFGDRTSIQNPNKLFPDTLYGNTTYGQNIKLLPAKINMPANYSGMEPKNLFGKIGRAHV